MELSPTEVLLLVFAILSAGLACVTYLTMRSLYLTSESLRIEREIHQWFDELDKLHIQSNYDLLEFRLKILDMLLQSYPKMKNDEIPEYIDQIREIYLMDGHTMHIIEEDW